MSKQIWSKVGVEPKYELQAMTEKDYENDPGIVIVYGDDNNVHTAISLPQAAAIPAPCLPGAVLNHRCIDPR